MIPESFSTFKPHLQYQDYPAYTEMLDKRMKASCYTTDDEQLVEVCKKDSNVLQARNITHQQIADKLESVLEKAYFLFFTHHFESCKALIDGTLRVELVVAGLSERCPFSMADKTLCGIALNTFNIINLTSNKCLSNVSDLNVHMIRDHYFFNGHIAKAYRVKRVDPELAIDVLRVQPSVDYKIQTITQTIWQEVTLQCPIDTRNLQAARENALEAYAPESEEFEAYVLPYKDDEYPPKIEPNSKETYLHIFNHIPLNVEITVFEIYRMGKAKINSIDINFGHGIYGMQQRTEPMLAQGDCLFSLGGHHDT